MAITFNLSGFDKANLITTNQAAIFARLSEYTGKTFEVSLDRDFESSFFFYEEGCREAVEFFEKLADELARREREADDS